MRTFVVRRPAAVLVAVVALLAGLVWVAPGAQAVGVGSVQGRVTLPDGSGAKGVYVQLLARVKVEDGTWVYGESPHVTTSDAVGNYSLDGVPTGTYEIRYGGFDHAWYRYRASADSASTPVVVTTGGTLEVELPVNDASVSGRVPALPGAPDAEEAWVQLVPDDETLQRQTERTAPGRRWSIDLVPAGTYAIRTTLDYPYAEAWSWVGGEDRASAQRFVVGVGTTITDLETPIGRIEEYGVLKGTMTVADVPSWSWLEVTFHRASVGLNGEPVGTEWTFNPVEIRHEGVRNGVDTLSWSVEVPRGDWKVCYALKTSPGSERCPDFTSTAGSNTFTVGSGGTATVPPWHWAGARTPEPPTVTPEPPTVTPAAPVLKVVKAPKVTGKAKVGKTLKASKGTWRSTDPKAKVTVKFQWQSQKGKKAVNVAKATKSKLKLTKKLKGKKVRVRVTVSAPGHKSVVHVGKWSKKVA